MSGKAAQFGQGLATGLTCGLLAAAALVYPPPHGLVPGGEALWEAARQTAWPWLRDNLGWSVLPFGLALSLFLHGLGRLRRALVQGGPERVAQLDQLTDIWSGLFFGIGVLWTAIGMRGALLYGLGDGAAAMAGQGPAGLLDRLVHGGLLTALTTTIVGGFGGYLLRLYKALRLGTAMKAYYGGLEMARRERVEGLLEDIRDRLPPRSTPPGADPCP